LRESYMKTLSFPLLSLSEDLGNGIYHNHR
jgi:hypothetical protein